MTQIVLFPILPRAIFNPKKYEKEITKALEEEGGIVERMYMRVGRGFSDPPVFQQNIKKNFLGLSIEIKTSSTPFVYIDQGTRKIWALMSDDFRPRTTARTLGIKSKQGSAVIRGRSAMVAHGLKARPGIEPRRYSEEIKKRREKPFAVKIRKAMAKASK